MAVRECCIVNVSSLVSSCFPFSHRAALAVNKLQDLDKTTRIHTTHTKDYAYSPRSNELKPEPVKWCLECALARRGRQREHPHSCISIEGQQPIERDSFGVGRNAKRRQYEEFKAKNKRSKIKIPTRLQRTAGEHGFDSTRISVTAEQSNFPMRKAVRNDVNTYLRLGSWALGCPSASYEHKFLAYAMSREPRRVVLSFFLLKPLSWYFARFFVGSCLKQIQENKRSARTLTHYGVQTGGMHTP